MFIAGSKRNLDNNLIGLGSKYKKEENTQINTTIEK